MKDSPTVYPRVGGETCGAHDDSDLSGGLSPRGRGNHPAGWAGRGGGGSIPAWAGKPDQGADRRVRPRVYPRVGGETWRFSGRQHLERGLSPRGRGNRPADGGSPPDARSIPAWAGKPARRRGAIFLGRVYPRVGGETRVGRRVPDHRTGLSPRGRGNPGQRFDHGPCARSIPAWAGKPRGCEPLQGVREVYPRVGGETIVFANMSPDPQGLSPRGRGNPPMEMMIRSRSRSIPAWAGKPRDSCSTKTCLRVYPRVGGETESP